MFELMHAKGLEVEAKPFAMGVRVEHPQGWVNEVQYHGEVVEDRLPPASYSLVCQVEGRGCTVSACVLAALWRPAPQVPVKL